jgi:hypothetical protein
MKGSGRGLYSGTIPVFVWANRGKPKKQNPDSTDGLRERYEPRI